MRTGPAMRMMARAFRAAASDIRRELSRLNNVADTNPSSAAPRRDRTAKVKQWMQERSGNRVRCC